ncbi:hypothetical protein BMT54_01240 [Pasteurellaceae bacterium 15-036681]|nr:hypothetical protein BMT54_01240 [Pasteurellaceae bacterium 15-036681]
MAKQVKVKHTVNRANQMAVRWCRQTQRAIYHLNALGFTVLSIDFTRSKPRIKVDVGNNKGVARALIESKKAVWYAQGHSEELGNWRGYYTMMEGIRVCWESKFEG